jgi:hypothetical protein
MITYTRRSLCTALATVGILAVANAAHAVNVSADGRGEVLLYPYYTTRVDPSGNAYSTLLSVVNGTASGKAVRVKFLEGRNSREVVGFNLFLSPFDVWTAAILPDATTGGAKIGTFDASCTLPSFSTTPVPPFYSFVNYEYTGADADGAGTGLDRTKEGHFEIIEMATYASSSTTGKAITHVNGIAPCGTSLTDMQAASDALPPNGGLFGAGTLLNANSGTDYTFDAVALANFYQVGSNYQASGTSLLDLTWATPPISSIHAPNGALYESTWSAGSADAVSAVLMHDSLMNEFVIDTGTKSVTDWVVTMPTKRYYISNGPGNAGKLFQRNFNGSAGSCDDVTRNMWDREERRFYFCGDGGNCFPLYQDPFTSVCQAANVITFNGNGVTSNVLGSINSSSVSAASVPTPFYNGWFSLGFATGIVGAATNVHKLINTGATSISGRGQATTTGNATTYIGLPVIGFAVTSFTNGTLVVGSQAVLSNYGGNFVHKTSTTIQ